MPNKYFNCYGRESSYANRLELLEEALAVEGPMNRNDLAVLLGVDIASVDIALAMLEAQGRLCIERDFGQQNYKAAFTQFDVFSLTDVDEWDSLPSTDDILGEPEAPEVNEVRILTDDILPALEQMFAELVAEAPALTVTIEQLKRDHERVQRILQAHNVFSYDLSQDAVIEVTDPDGFNFRIEGESVQVSLPDDD